MNRASVLFLSEISPLHSSLLPITCETLCVSLVGPSGLEPPTSCLSGTRSNLLSYEPLQFCGISHSGSPNLSLIHLKIYQVPAVRSFSDWWRWWDSNSWPPACRAGALPTELHPRILFLFLRAIPYVEEAPVSFFSKVVRSPSLFLFRKRRRYVFSSVSALSYLPVQSPAKYFRHCRA